MVRTAGGVRRCADRRLGRPRDVPLLAGILPRRRVRRSRSRSRRCRHRYHCCCCLLLFLLLALHDEDSALATKAYHMELQYYQCPTLSDHSLVLAVVVLVGVVVVLDVFLVVVIVIVVVA